MSKIDVLYPVVIVRLVGGPSRHFGRVVVSLNGEDGTICNRNFTLKDARVVCNMMGYKYVNTNLSTLL